MRTVEHEPPDRFGWWKQAPNPLLIGETEVPVQPDYMGPEILFQCRAPGLSRPLKKEGSSYMDPFPIPNNGLNAGMTSSVDYGTAARTGSRSA